MHDLNRILLTTIGTAFLTFSMGLVSEAQSPSAPSPNTRNAGRQGTPSSLAFYGEGFVLLQHGNVLRGFVKPQSDRITITLDKGSEVTIPNRQVLSIGKSMESLYAFQIKAIRKWGTGEHWHLAQWCIQNGLLDQAIEHYTELEITLADTPKFKQLDLQLRQALLADAQVQKALEERGIPNPIAPASYEETSEPSNLSQTKSPNDNRLNQDGNPPAGTGYIVPGYLRRGFQIDIMPVVVSRCGQAGCHGMLAKNPFQIFQPVGEQASSISQKNLDTLMSYVDHADPTQTSLIQYAIRPHGSQRNPSIQPNRDEDRVLLDKILSWLRSVKESESGSPPIAESAPVAPAMALIPKNAVQQAMRRRSAGDIPQQDRTAKLSKPPKSAPPPVVLDAAELKEIEDAISRLEQTHREQTSSRDPFDPNVFNAKFSNNPNRGPSE
jgi:hypothetical protein